MGRPSPTNNGYNLFECASALQKAIRRGLVEEAMFWAVELDLSGYGNYVWKRLRIIASEDIGLADPLAAILIRALYENWQEQRVKPQKSEREFIVHAICYLATAPKSRVLDHANMVFYTGHDEQAKNHPVPEYALDHHTRAGRARGASFKDFFEESIKLDHAQADGPHELLQEVYAGRDRFQDTARQLKEAGMDTAPKRPVGRSGRSPQMTLDEEDEVE